LLNDTFTFSGWNFPNDYGVVKDPETGNIMDFGTPPVQMTFDGIAETAGGMMVNEQVVEWDGLPGGIPAVQAAGIDGMTDFNLTDWENPGEIVEFSFTTVGGGWLSEFDTQSGYSVAGLDWSNASAGLMPSFYETGFYFYWTHNGTPATGYSTIQPQIGLLVGAHPFDPNVQEVTYIAYSSGQVDDVTDSFEGGFDFNSATTQLDENNGSWNLLAFVMNLPPFATGFATPANGFHVGMLVNPPVQIALVPGDTDGDGDVDLLDFNTLKDNFGTMGGVDKGDFNDDGNVTLEDFNILKDNFGAGAAAVPEPATWILGCLSFVAMLGYARFRKSK
jgi:hypothetical protein